MQTITPLTRDELRAAYRKYFQKSFPANELRPLLSMERMIAAGNYRAVALRDGGADLIYACLWIEGNYILIDYMVSPPENRGKGYGGALLRALRAHYPPEYVLFGESEAPVGDPARDEIIRRRLEFYRRSGGRILGYDIALFGVRYKTLAFGDAPVDETALMTAHAAFYRKKLPAWVYNKAVKIPYTGQPLEAFGKWEEEDS